MKKVILIILSLFIVSTVYASDYTKTKTFTNGAVADADDVTYEFNAIATASGTKLDNTGDTTTGALIFSGVSDDIQTLSNQDFTINCNGTGDIYLDGDDVYQVTDRDLNESMITATTSALTYYVDPSSGTDDTSHGTGTGTNAFATIQYAIDQVPKYLAHDVIINCADDVYSITSAIEIYGFVGEGTLTIQGDTDDTQDEVDGKWDIDTASNNINGFTVVDCSAYVIIEGFYIDSDSQEQGGVVATNSSLVSLFYNRIHNFDYAVRASNNSFINVMNCDLDDNDDGIYAFRGSTVKSETNTSTTTNDQYGLNSWASVIYKEGTQPTGTSANENTRNGGQIN